MTVAKKREPQLPRTYEEALKLYGMTVEILIPNGHLGGLLRWFFDKGKASGLHNATKHCNEAKSPYAKMLPNRKAF